MMNKQLLTTIALSAGLLTGGATTAATGTLTAEAATTWTKGLPKPLRHSRWESHSFKSIGNSRARWGMAFWNSDVSGELLLSGHDKFKGIMHHAYYHHAAGSKYYYLRGDEWLNDMMDMNTHKTFKIHEYVYYRITLAKNKAKYKSLSTTDYYIDPKHPEAQPAKQHNSAEDVMDSGMWMERVGR